MRVVQHNIDDDRQKTAEQRSAVVDLAAAGCAVPGGTAGDELVTPDVSEHGGEVDPALSDDLEVGRVGRSYLVGAEGLSLERLCCLDHGIGRNGEIDPFSGADHSASSEVFAFPTKRTAAYRSSNEWVSSLPLIEASYCVRCTAMLSP